MTTAGEAIGSALWVMSTLNITVALVGLLAWIIIWGAKFKVFSTLGGSLVYLFALALFLWSASSVIGNLGSATRSWWDPPATLVPWWYAFRYLSSLFVLIMVVAIDWTLVQRIRGKYPPAAPGSPADPLDPPLRDPRPR